MQKSKLVPKILVLTALIATVSLGWLAGHILRFSIPALWHPPIEENNPQIKTGFEFEFEGIRRLAVLPETSLAPQVRVYLGEMQVICLSAALGIRTTHPCPRSAGPRMGGWSGQEKARWEIILDP